MHLVPKSDIKFEVKKNLNKHKLNFIVLLKMPNEIVKFGRFGNKKFFLNTQFKTIH